MKRVMISVPVAEFEDTDIVLKSARHLSSRGWGELQYSAIVGIMKSLGSAVLHGQR